MKKLIALLSVLLAFCLIAQGTLPVMGRAWAAEAVIGENASPVTEDGDEEADASEDASANGVLFASTTSLELEVGETKTVTMTFYASGYLTYNPYPSSYFTATWGSWYQSGRKIDLTITGKKAGSTTITITNSYNSDKVKIKLKVKKASKVSGKYRALLIGERTFSWETIQRNVGDMNMMKTMLGKIYTPSKTKYSVKTYIDATYSDVRSLIQSTFSGTKSDSVSLFFIATHGNNSGDGELSMAKGSIDLPLSTLASWLNTYVKGKVIVILESCGAGSAVFRTKAEENDKEALANALIEENRQAAAFTAAAVKAFADADPGIVESNSTGDFRTSKFYVLAAARHRELSWGTESGPYNYFTKWLVDGVGSTSGSPADRKGNNNGKITLNELFNYIKSVGNNYGFYYQGKYYYQHVQRYPVGSSYVLFRTK